MHLTYKEIMIQYEAMSRTYDAFKARRDEIRDFFNSSSNIVYIGCGSSYDLCCSASFMTAVETGKKTAAFAAGDILINMRNYDNILKDATVVALSRSGMTSEIIETVQKLKNEYNSKVFSIICNENTTLDALSQMSMNIPWAFDESVCQTRSVTNLYTGTLLLNAAISESNAVWTELIEFIRHGEAYLKELEPLCKDIADRDFDDVIVLSDGATAGLSKEAALAFCEISNVPGAHYNVLDVRHGPMVLINDRTLVILCLNKGEAPLQKALVSDLRNKNASVVVFNGPEKSGFDVLHDITINKDYSPSIYGIPFINIAQLTAYYAAVKRSVNPDQPNGLSAWIEL